MEETFLFLCFGFLFVFADGKVLALTHVCKVICSEAASNVSHLSPEGFVFKKYLNKIVTFRIDETLTLVHCTAPCRMPRPLPLCMYSEIKIDVMKMAKNRKKN